MLWQRRLALYNCLVKARSLIGLLGVLALTLLVSILGVLAIQDSTTILVELQLRDHNIGWVDTDIDSGTVALLAGDTLDVDNVLLAVHLDHLALTSRLLPRTTMTSSSL